MPTTATALTERFDLHLDVTPVLSPAARRAAGARHRIDLAGRRLTNPHQTVAWARRLTDRVRGDWTEPQQEGPTLGERLLERWSDRR